MYLSFLLHNFHLQQLLLLIFVVYLEILYVFDQPVILISLINYFHPVHKLHLILSFEIVFK